MHCICGIFMHIRVNRAILKFSIFEKSGLWLIKIRIIPAQITQGIWTDGKAFSTKCFRDSKMLFHDPELRLLALLPVQNLSAIHTRLPERSMNGLCRAMLLTLCACPAAGSCDRLGIRQLCIR